MEIVMRQRLEAELSSSYMYIFVLMSTLFLNESGAFQIREMPKSTRNRIASSVRLLATPLQPLNSD